MKKIESTFEGRTFSFEEAHKKISDFISSEIEKLTMPISISISHAIVFSNCYGTTSQPGEKVQLYYASVIILWK